MEVSAMSQPILYHAFGIKGATYHSTDYRGNGVIFNVETTDHYVPCIAHNANPANIDGRKHLGWRDPT
jgi:hypothetical protein